MFNKVLQGKDAHSKGPTHFRVITGNGERPEMKVGKNEPPEMIASEMGLRKTSSGQKANSDSGCGTQCRVQLEAGQKSNERRGLTPIIKISL